jgi:hypothetical protein
MQNAISEAVKQLRDAQRQVQEINASIRRVDELRQQVHGDAKQLEGAEPAGQTLNELQTLRRLLKNGAGQDVLATQLTRVERQHAGHRGMPVHCYVYMHTVDAALARFLSPSLCGAPSQHLWQVLPQVLGHAARPMVSLC